MARNIREPIPLPVILAASEGDERALNAVLNHYIIINLFFRKRYPLMNC